MSGRIRVDTSSRLPLDPEDLPPAGESPSSWETKARPAPPPSPYVELWARTNFSFLRGATKPHAMMKKARDLGYDACAVTDTDGLYGIVRAHEEAVKQGLRVLVGSELTLHEGPPHGTLVLLVENHAGYTNLCRILTRTHRDHPKGAPRPEDDEVPRNTYAGVGVDFVCANAEGLWAVLPVLPEPRDGTVAALKDAFGDRLSLGIVRHDDGLDPRREAVAVISRRRFDVAVVATNAVRYAEPDDKPVYDVLHCIREGLTLDEAGRVLAPNAEAHLKSPEAMVALFADRPEWIARTRVVADACRFAMTELRYSFPYAFGKDPTVLEPPDDALRRRTYEGARERYDGVIPESVVALIEKELALIAKLEVAPYFLSVQEVVWIAQRRKILCQGRGSAANSAVCYCLGITAVDPARSSLLFERFLSAERREPPDIDVDFEHERREEVIQEIYERYGRDRAAMVCEVVSYRGKSALKEVGKVFGMSLEQIDRLATLVSWWDRIADVDPDRLRRAGFDGDDARVATVLTLAAAIQGFPRHVSIHVGGFVLSATPLCEIAPVEPATMKDRTIIPWDKDDLDTLGFFKLDVLGLGILTMIRKALAMARHDARIDGPDPIAQLARIPAEDPVVYDALCEADTVGVFQIESRAQMAMLPRLKPRKFYDLVIEVAIVRPGPIQGGMIHPYLRRRRGLEDSRPPHPCLEPILARTLGVPLFQEQVMQIAIVGAGYSGGDADRLRRDMAAWRRTGNLERHKDRLANGFAERGISAEFAARLYEQIHGFAEYGFPESHASSFALLVYASAWLKVHHPAEFAAALVNSQPMGFYSPSTILQDAARHGVGILPIDVASSDWDCTVVRDPGKGPGSIRVGFRQIKGFPEESARHVERARAEAPFRDVADLVARTGIARRDLTALAESGALASLEPDRKSAMWSVRAPLEAKGSLFAGRVLGDPKPALAPLGRGTQLRLDYERTGLSVADHPMRLFRETFGDAPRVHGKFARRRGMHGSTDLPGLAHGAKVTVAGLVICRQRPATASGVVFVTMEDENGFLNLVLYAHVFETYRHVATTSSLLVAHGKIERDGGVIYVVAESLEPLSADDFDGDRRDARDGALPSDLPSQSRDFH
ncbi:MAG: error-prone DNA polymerase [Polyangiaceae bacterium]